MNEFIQRLKAGLAGDLPGERAQYRMASKARPRLQEALARATRQYQSAVLLYLYPRQGSWSTVLMKRPEYDGTHAGQVSIPGGRLERGETHTQAALREFREETGVAVDSHQLLGGLSELFIPPSSYMVRPFVAYTTAEPRFQPDPVEVEQIIELPVATLMDEATVRRGSVRLDTGVRVKTPYFYVQGHVVWGATAMILSELKQVLLTARCG